MSKREDRAHSDKLDDSHLKLEVLAVGTLGVLTYSAWNILVTHLI